MTYVPTTHPVLRGVRRGDTLDPLPPALTRPLARKPLSNFVPCQREVFVRVVQGWWEGVEGVTEMCVDRVGGGLSGVVEVV